MKKKNKQSFYPPLVVLGLGNPGARFEGSRHNVGYLVVNKLLKEPPKQMRRRLFSSYAVAIQSVEDTSGTIVLARYSGYMNNSGEVALPLLRRFSAPSGNLLVVVDNMDLPPGICRLKKGGSDAGHNGLKSIIRALGTTDFMRLYVGVGRPSPGVSVVDHVLGRPDADDEKHIDSAALRASQAIVRLLSEPFERVAEELNRRES